MRPQLTELGALLDEHFPVAGTTPAQPARGLASLLRLDRVVLPLTCSGMDDVIDVAAGRLADACTQIDAAALAAALRAREAEVSSAIGSGVAVPCAYLPGTEPSAALVPLSPPLPYDTPDGAPLRLVVVLVEPRDAPDRRLVLAEIARLAGRGLAERLSGTDFPSDALWQILLPGGRI